MTDFVFTAVLDDLKDAYTAIDRREHATLGRGLADREHHDICMELPTFANAVQAGALAGGDIGPWLDRLGAAVLAAKVAWAFAQANRVDTGTEAA